MTWSLLLICLFFSTGHLFLKNSSYSVFVSAVRFPCSDVGLLFGNMEVPYGFFEGDYGHKNGGFKFRTLYL